MIIYQNYGIDMKKQTLS